MTAASAGDYSRGRHCFALLLLMLVYGPSTSFASCSYDVQTGNCHGNSCNFFTTASNVGTVAECETECESFPICVAFDHDNPLESSGGDCYLFQGSGCSGDGDQGGTSEMIIPGGESKGVVNLLEMENTFGRSDNNSSPIPVDWCILDNQSTVNVFRNGKYLKNIRQVKNYVLI